ncbi:tail assembly chaperone [Microbacterium phage Zeta1847]|uniref:Tal assembly chaperone n=1 Tax=Microbacterium phage Zeta1847 TaxID=2201444 RepID=A0A2Z4Q996_9CAUD|nr:tail assembly chaperone [Microbacterium phage Zeta1847]AWY06646.1 tail assembly chaperone [Microbacterium phage Zeta1847]
MATATKTTPRKPAARKLTESAIAAEAVGDRVPFEFRGETFGLLPTSEWSLNALEAFEEGRVVAFLKDILGADYAKLRGLDIKVADLEEFVADAKDALGIAGN